MEQAKLYIEHCKSNETLPSVEGFVVYLMEGYVDTDGVVVIDKLPYNDASKLAREYKGYIDTYAISFLKHKAGLGGRNSQNYIQLLKEYKEAENDLNEGIEAVNIIIDLPQGKQEANVVYEDIDKEGKDA